MVENRSIEDVRTLSIQGRELELLIDPHAIWVSTPDSSGENVIPLGVITKTTITTYGTSQSHLCGYTGYNPERGDSCPGCDDKREIYGIMEHIQSMRDSFYQ